MMQNPSKAPEQPPFQFSEDDFPSLERFENKQQNLTHMWKIPNPTTKLPDGSTPMISSAEAVLNWQSHNAVAQNKVLKKLDLKIDRNYNSLEQKLQKEAIDPLQLCLKRIEFLH